MSYGTAIPRFRIQLEEIATAWNKDSQQIQKSLQVSEKSVADVDEDAATLAIEASLQALERAVSGQRSAVRNLNSKVPSPLAPRPSLIGAVYIGSESHPYVVKPTATIVGNALGIGPEYFAADLEFACKAGTAAMQVVSSLIQSKQIDYGLSIGSDTAQGAPGDVLEYTAAAGAAAYILGNKKREIIATLEATSSYSTDTPDFWRPQKSEYPEHAGRFTGQPGYFHHVLTATNSFLQNTKMSIKDFAHVVFHMPNGSFPKRVAKELGVTNKQLQKGDIVSEIGNTYSASSLLGLASILDHAKPGEKILLTSYGSGAGADCFTFTVTNQIRKYKREQTVQKMIQDKTYISYNEYLNMRGKIQKGKCLE